MGQLQRIVRWSWPTALELAKWVAEVGQLARKHACPGCNASCNCARCSRWEHRVNKYAFFRRVVYDARSQHAWFDCLWMNMTGSSSSSIADDMPSLSHLLLMSKFGCVERTMTSLRTLSTDSVEVCSVKCDDAEVESMLWYEINKSAISNISIAMPEPVELAMTQITIDAIRKATTTHPPPVPSASTGHANATRWSHRSCPNRANQTSSNGC
jgi:hypothetical protein